MKIAFEIFITVGILFHTFLICLELKDCAYYETQTKAIILQTKKHIYKQTLNEMY